MSNAKKAKTPATDKDKKSKLVRDSFTIPKQEYAALDTLKARALAAGVAIKKSELLRAGLMALSGMSDAAFKSALSAVPTLKTGRPAQEVNTVAAAKTPVTASTPAAQKPRVTAPKASTQAAAQKAVPSPATKPPAKRSGTSVKNQSPSLS